MEAGFSWLHHICILLTLHISVQSVVMVIFKKLDRVTQCPNVRTEVTMLSSRTGTLPLVLIYCSEDGMRRV